MDNPDVTLFDLRKAYEEWIATPRGSLELLYPRPNDKIPAEIEILFFQPPKEDHLSAEEFFTYIATAGMSTRNMRGSRKRMELILFVQGQQDSGDLRKLGEKLGEIALLPFRDNSYFAPNMIIRDVSLPLFEGMDCLLTTHVTGYTSEYLYLPGLDLGIQLLRIRPIYRSEADLIEEIGDIEALRRFNQEGIDWDDPRRRPAQLKETGKDTIQSIWADIERWYKRNAPRLFKYLREGATEEQLLDLEKHLGLSLPYDYKKSLRIHNGDIYISRYNYHLLRTCSMSW